VLTKLFTKMLVDALNMHVYNAEIAGLGYSINNTKHGFQVSDKFRV
jgi:secreted Zn-dependent insulinase-like peptidase